MVVRSPADELSRPERPYVTEIPEHLLKRSRERRGAVGLPGGETPAGEPGTAVAPAAAATPAPAKAKAAAPKAPVVKPDRPEVAAAKARRKVPFWALPVLGLLPIWLFIYAEAMSPPTKKLTGPLAEGATVFANCAGCHGANGAGGAGYQLNEGSVRKTFPNFADQLTFVSNGSPGAGKAYGDPARGRISGALGGGQMAVWKNQLTPKQLIAVVCHERFTLQGLGADNQGAYAAEYAKYCAPDAPEFAKAAG
jgi:hypothetical protein